MEANPKIFYPDFISPQRTIGRRTFDFSRQVAVMAIINRTPDSFHDRGRTFELSNAITAVENAIVHEADWLDIGGVPFAPGPEVTEREEIDRVLPVVEAARERTDAVISVETYRPEVARAVLAAGADVINNVTGLHDLALADVVAEAGGGLIITHSLAAPRTPLPRPAYEDVAGEVAAFLRERADAAISRGVPEDRIILDPGHDLNKNTYHSLELTRHLPEITGIGYPTLVAVSNKDFIGETLNRPQDERLPGTIATLAVCILQGARIVRVHDVAEIVPSVRMVESILGWRPPATARHNLV
ncbi:dihydropteroate synthase [Actinoallomurus bryophytorum]|uniref:Dihydropteroate synthase n=1 Tax=Actinoallomurus bryophytorum TaxID=1490222 RepID=A0A543CFZ7_9ACTN|nr:dihydropteroate synthase [Actinoallomurus bryophytorum]TQL96031.1 dihydropteroate synthase [Actinoallomurus bryophytorum]